MATIGSPVSGDVPKRPAAAVRSTFRAALAVAFCIFHSSCGPEAAPQTASATPPDLFLVVIDCLRADHVGAYGHATPTTPNLDALARESVLFEAAYTNSTWTKPSIATLFSSLHPTEHGLLVAGVPPRDEIETDALPESVPYLPEILARSGYRTIAAVNQVHLGPALGFARGFDDYRWRKTGQSAFRMSSDFTAALAEAPHGKPVFGWIHYLDAHWPYNRGRREAPDGLGDGKVSPEPPKEQTRAIIEAWTKEHLDEKNRRALAVRYDREVHEVDRAVGELFAALREAGRWDHAWVVVTADHGEAFFEHGRLMHGFEPYDEVARVPFLVKPPAGARIDPGRRRSVISHVDFAPTVLELLALPPLADAAGSSYAAVVAGEEEPARGALLQTEFTNAIRQGTRKLIAHSDGRVELYDLIADPGERLDLASRACAGDCARMRDELAARLARLRPPPERRRTPLDAEDVDELQALGYL